MNLACGYWLNAILQPLFPHELKSNLPVRNFAIVFSSSFWANALDACLKWSFIPFMKLPKNLVSRSTGEERQKHKVIFLLYWWYRVFQVSCMIKNRYISALRTARDLLKTSTWRLWNAVLSLLSSYAMEAWNSLKKEASCQDVIMANLPLVSWRQVTKRLNA